MRTLFNCPCVGKDKNYHFHLDALQTNQDSLNKMVLLAMEDNAWNKTLNLSLIKRPKGYQSKKLKMKLLQFII